MWRICHDYLWRIPGVTAFEVYETVHFPLWLDKPDAPIISSSALNESCENVEVV